MAKSKSKRTPPATSGPSEGQPGASAGDDLREVKPWSFDQQHTESTPQKARTPVLVVFLGSLWLLLNNGGGSDLAKAPPYLFSLLWWIWALVIAWQLVRRPEGLWESLGRAVKVPLLLLICACLINLSAADQYAVQAFVEANQYTSQAFSASGQLSLLAWLGWVWWGGLLISGMLLVHWLADDLAGLAPVILQCVLLIGLLIAIGGLLEYAQSGGAEHLRGVFAWHTPAGGYFALLLPIVLARALGERDARLAIMYSAVTLLFGFALLATNSRGAWLTAAIGILFLTVRLLFAKLAIPMRVGALAGAMVLAIALPFLIGGPLSPIKERIISLSARGTDFSVIGRTEFFGTAWRLFTKGPDREKQGLQLFGTGLGTYKYLGPQQQENPRFYSSDPHSIFFHWLAELGVIGVAAYLMLWGWWAWIQWGTPLLRPPAAEPALSSDLWPGMQLDLHGICAGLLAGWLHWTIDFDATYMLITWTAIILMALLIATLRQQAGAPPIILPPQPVTDARPSGARLREVRLTQAFSGVLSIILMIGTWTALTYSSAKLFYDHAEDQFLAWKQFQSLDALPASHRAYSAAVLFFPMDGDSWRGLSMTELWLATSALAAGPEDPQVGAYTLEKAFAHGQQATRVASYDARNWNNLAQLYSARLAFGQLDQLTAANALQTCLITAIDLDPLNNPRYYIQLTQGLSLGESSETRDSAIVFNMERLRKYYPTSEITDMSKTRMDWQSLPLGYGQVWPFYLLALRGLNDTKGVQIARQEALADIIPAIEQSEYINNEEKLKIIPILRAVVDQIDDTTGSVTLSPDLLQSIQGLGLTPLSLDKENPPSPLDVPLP